jgi:hypothetical protein
VGRGAEKLFDVVRLDPEAQDSLFQPEFAVKNGDVFKILDPEGDGHVQVGRLLDPKSHPPEVAALLGDLPHDAWALLRLGAGNEDPLLLPAVQLPAVQDGDPRAAFFNWDILIQLTRSFVASEAGEKSLVAKLTLAKKARHPLTRRLVVGSYIRQVERHTNRNVTKAHSDILMHGASIGLLLPASPSSGPTLLVAR